MLTSPMRQMLTGFADGRPTWALLDGKRGGHATLSALETRGYVQFRSDGGMNGVARSGDYVITAEGHVALTDHQPVA